MLNEDEYVFFQVAPRVPDGGEEGKKEVAPPDVTPPVDAPPPDTTPEPAPPPEAALLVVAPPTSAPTERTSAHLLLVHTLCSSEPLHALFDPAASEMTLSQLEGILVPLLQEARKKGGGPHDAPLSLPLRRRSASAPASPGAPGFAATREAVDLFFPSHGVYSSATTSSSTLRSLGLFPLAHTPLVVFANLRADAGTAAAPRGACDATVASTFDASPAWIAIGAPFQPVAGCAATETGLATMLVALRALKAAAPTEADRAKLLSAFRARVPFPPAVAALRCCLLNRSLRDADKAALASALLVLCARVAPAAESAAASAASSAPHAPPVSLLEHTPRVLARLLAAARAEAEAEEAAAKATAGAGDGAGDGDAVPPPSSVARDADGPGGWAEIPLHDAASASSSRHPRAPLLLIESHLGHRLTRASL